MARVGFILVVAACASGAPQAIPPADGVVIDDARSEDAGDAASHDALVDGGVMLPADPWTLDTACTPVDLAAVIPLFQPGSSEVTLAQTFAAVTRSRTCHHVTGCTPWLPGGVQLSSDGIYDPPSSGGVRLRISTVGIEVELGPAPESTGATCYILRNGEWCQLWSEGPSGPLLVAFAGGSPHESGIIQLHHKVCADGRYQIVSQVPGNTINDLMNRKQIAIHGRLF